MHLSLFRKKLALAKLPNGENAVVDTENKLRRYCLNLDHLDRNGNLKGGHHAMLFLCVLGIGADQAQMLADELLKAAASGDAIHKGRREFLNDYGKPSRVDNYEIRFTMTGPDGRTAEIISGWHIVDDRPPHLSTCYVGKGKSSG